MRHPVLRPLWVIGLTALGACWIGAGLSAWLWYLAGAAGVLCITVLCIPPLRSRRVLIVMLATAVLTFVWLNCREQRYNEATAHAGETVTLRVELQKSDGTATVRVLSGALPAGTRLRLYSEPPTAALSDHDVVETEFELIPQYASGLDKLQQKASGCWLAAYPTDREGAWERVPTEPSVASRLTDIRDMLTNRVRGLLGGDTGSVVTGICLGTDTALSDTAALDFRQCGVTHLFAVSGLHLSILTAVFTAALKRIHLHRTVRGLLCAVAVVGLSTLIGWSPSVARAAILCLFVTVGNCCRRPADTRNSMGGALLLLLAIDPFAAYDAGLLLSFFATFGLLFLSPSLRTLLLRLPVRGVWQRLWNPIAETVSLTVAATVATLPITVVYFREISLISVLSNLLMSVPSSVLLVVGCVAMLLISIGAAVFYRPLLLLCGWLADILLWLGRLLSDIPVAVLAVNRTAYSVWICGSALVLCFGYRIWRRRGLAIAAVCSAIALLVAMVSPQPTDTALRIDTVDTVTCISYRDTAVLVFSETDAAALYTARELIRDTLPFTPEAVFVIGADNPTLEVADKLLGVSVPQYTGDTPLPTVWEDVVCSRTEQTIDIVRGRFGIRISNTETLLLIDGTAVPLADEFRVLPTLFLEENGTVRVRR